jgi:hypothetical protein
LIDDDVNDPNLRRLEATLVDTVKTTVSTAGFADVNSTQPQPRVLVGNVADPLYGNVSSIGYMDASRPATIPGGFDDSTVTYVRFELARTYLYGDTTTVLPLELRQVEGSWTPTGLSSDTTLGTGDLITSVNMTVTDTLLAIQLPAAWVAANGGQFNSGDFVSAFEGFALQVNEAYMPMPGAVVGFDVSSSQSRIRIGTRSDTISYPLSEVFSKLTRAERPPSPAGLLALRADAPVGAKIQFDFQSIGAVALARAVLRLPIDRSLSGVDSAMPAFVRPLASRIGVYAIREEASTLLIGEALVTDTGDARTSGTTGLTSIVQDILLGATDLKHIELRLAVSPLSLDVLPLVLPGLPDQDRPRLNLTVVGQPL